MTMSINLQTGSGYQAPVPVPQVLPGARSTDIQVVQKQPEQYTDTNQATQTDTTLPLPGTSSNDDDTPMTAEEKRFQQVAAAAQHVTSDPYPVSDKSFTIYKDATGQYITRYTSLRDGRVTYVPEPQALRQFEASQQTLKAALQLKV